MSINRPLRPRPPQPQPSPQPSPRLLVASVLGQVAQAVNSSRMTAQRHQAFGCPRPGRCAPCKAEAARSWREYLERERVEVAAQHRESMARLSQRPVSPRTARMARDVARAEATRRIGGAGARCLVCRTDHADGSRSCRSCGTETADASADVAGFLDTLNGHHRPPERPPSTRGTGGRVGRCRRPAERP